MSRTAEVGEEFRAHPRAAIKQLRRAWVHYNLRHGQIPDSADVGVFKMVRAGLSEFGGRAGSGPINFDSARQLQRGLSAGSEVVQVFRRFQE